MPPTIRARYVLARVLKDTQYPELIPPGFPVHTRSGLKKTAAGAQRRTRNAIMDAPNEEWTDNELRAAVRDYFTMLQAELRGRSSGTLSSWYARVRRPSDRDADQVENRHRQIAAVLIDNGLPCSIAHAPAWGYRQSLVRTVREYLHNHPHMLELMEGAVFRPVRTLPELESLEPRRVLDRPPEPAPDAPGPVEATMPEHRELITGVDYLEKEQRNRSLASAGEQFVLAFERRRLRAQGQHKYAESIEHISAEHGEGSGFEILSYSVDGTARYIQVKTTRFRKETPLYLTAHEIAMALAYRKRYWIYRVFEFRDQPRLYMLNAPSIRRFTLEPTQYRVRF